MQINPRAAVFAAALFACGVGTSTAGSEASTKETQATTKQDDCTLPALPSTSPDKLASLLPKPGTTPPDPAEVDRRLRKADACARAAGLRAAGDGSTATQPSSSTGL